MLSKAAAERGCTDDADAAFANRLRGLMMVGESAPAAGCMMDIAALMPDTARSIAFFRNPYLGPVIRGSFSVFSMSPRRRVPQS